MIPTIRSVTLPPTCRRFADDQRAHRFSADPREPYHWRFTPRVKSEFFGEVRSALAGGTSSLRLRRSGKSQETLAEPKYRGFLPSKSCQHIKQRAGSAGGPPSSLIF
jgi:hypothetical protein